MSDQYIQQQLCKKLDDLGTNKTAKNTVYRKLWNWEGESRWTLLFSVYETLQQAADFVNSVMPTDQLQIDSLPASYMMRKKFQEYQEAQKLQTAAKVENEKKESTATTDRKKVKKRSPAESEPEKTTSVAQEAILVAKSVDRVLSMRSLHESLQNAQISIAQFTLKKRYKNDDVLVALLFSLLNSANRIEKKIQVFLTELQAM